MEFIILGVIMLLFTIWTIFVKYEKINQLDAKIYSLIKITDKKTIALRVITSFASTKFFVILVFFLLFFMKNKKLALVIAGLLAMNGIVNETFKRIFKRERPNINRLVVEKGYSYPSGHTMSATCFYGFLSLLVIISNIIFPIKIILEILLVLLVVIIGFSRIYLGVHYFSDVVGGFLLGIAYLILYVQLVQALVNIF